METAHTIIKLKFSLTKNNNTKTMMQKKFNRTTLAAEELRFDDIDLDDSFTNASTLHSRRTGICDSAMAAESDFERVPDEVADTAETMHKLR